MRCLQQGYLAMFHRSHPLPRRSQLGFTLMELLIVLAISGIVMALATPNMSEQLSKRRVYGEVKSMRDALRLAKSAGESNKTFDSTNPAAICPSSDGASCSGSWSDGFIAFGDVDGNGNFNGTDVILASQVGLSSNTTLKVDNLTSGTSVSLIRLTTQGYTASFDSNNAPYYLFTFCNKYATSKYHIAGVGYGPGGVIRMAADTNNDGIPEFNGVNLTCP